MPMYARVLIGGLAIASGCGALVAVSGAISASIAAPILGGIGLIIGAAAIVSDRHEDRRRRADTEMQRAASEAENAAAVEKAFADGAADAASHAADARRTVAAAVRRLSDRLGDGDLTARLELAEDALDADAVAQLNGALTKLNTAIDEALALADVASEGDLSARATGKYNGHAKVLVGRQNALLDGLAALVRTLRASAAANAGRSHGVAEVADALLASTTQQLSELSAVAEQVAETERRLTETVTRAESGRAAVEETVAAADGGREKITLAVEAMRSVDEASARIGAVVDLIESIAQQTSLLAVNASVEAARAGAAGRGFAIVSQEVIALSGRTADAAKDIASIVRETQKFVDAGSSAVSASGTAIDTVTDRVRIADERAKEIVAACTAEAAQTAECASRVSEARKAADENLRRANDAQELSADLATGAQELESAVQGVLLEDEIMISEVTARAARISQMFEEAIASGRWTMEELFSRDYDLIEGSNPAQHMTPFVPITDALLPPILESVYDIGEGIAFSAAVNLDGFLPTHNKKFSQTPKDDPVWNSANCRNRRFFNDRVGLAAGQNEAPYLLQAYRRDMGGGSYVTMKDISAPIWVRGRHWGGLRIGYRTIMKSLKQPATGQAESRAA